MKKTVFVLLALLACLMTASALGETLTFDAICAEITLSDSYTVLTPQNLYSHETFLAEKYSSAAETEADFLARGVLCQAWDSTGKACLEITAVQDEDALRLFDIQEQTVTTRAAYRAQYTSKGSPMGYNCSSAEWKNYASVGRFLMIQYTNKVDGEVAWRGYARRTVRNGYTITLDWKVFGRSLTNKDSSAINSAVTSWKYTQILPMTPKAQAGITVSKYPAVETNSANATISGTCAEGVRFTAVVGGLSMSSPFVVTAEGKKDGTFSIPITLPQAGFFVITVTADYQGYEVLETNYTVTYQSNLLPVNFDETVPNTIAEDALIISGTTLQGVKAQLIVNDGSPVTRSVNSDKTFSFKIKTEEEGVYRIVLVLSKKGLADRRFTYTVTRTMSDAERKLKIQQAAIKPAYSTLIGKLKAYDGRIMGYNVYVTHIAQAGDEWIITAAMKRTNTGYDNYIAIVTDQMPEQITINALTKMYGKLAGTHEVLNDEGKSDSYPCFELLFWAAAD